MSIQVGVDFALSDDPRFEWLLDYFEVEQSASTVLVEQGEAVISEQVQTAKEYLKQLTGESIDIRLYVYDIVLALQINDFERFITASDTLFSNTQLSWQECHPVMDVEGSDGTFERVKSFNLLSMRLPLISKLNLITHNRVGSWNIDSWRRNQHSNGAEQSHIDDIVVATDARIVKEVVVELRLVESKCRKYAEFLVDNFSASSSTFQKFASLLEELVSNLCLAWNIEQEFGLVMDDEDVKDQQSQYLKGTATLDEGVSQVTEVHISSDNELKAMKVHKGAQANAQPVTLKMSDIEVTNKQDAIELLKKIALYFKKNEVSSPVPGLLDRAIKLASKDFVAVLEELAPESVAKIKVLYGLSDDKANQGDEQ